MTTMMMTIIKKKQKKALDGINKLAFIKPKLILMLLHSTYSQFLLHGFAS
jgi:hypothetical protein